MKSYLRALRFLWPYKFLLLAGIVTGLIASVCDVLSIASIVPFLKAASDPEGFSAQLQSISGSGKLPVLKDSISALISRLQEIATEDVVLTLTIIVYGAAILTILKALFGFLSRFIAEYASERATLDLRAALYAKVLYLPLGFFTRLSLGEILSRFTNDLGNVARGFRISFGRFAREPITFLIAAGAALLLDWHLSQLRLTFIVLIAAPVAAWATRRLIRRIRKSSTRALQRKADIVGLLEDTISGVKVVKVSQTERSESGRLRSLQSRLIREIAKVVAADNALSPCVEVIAAGAAAGLFFAATRLIDLMPALKGPLPGLAFFYYKAYSSAKRITGSLGAFPIADAGAARLFELMDLPPEAADVAGALELPPLMDHISFENVSFSYEEGGPHVVRNVSFATKKGEVLAIVGSSGAGKTSLVNLIPRFYLPSSGQITIDGHDISRVALPSLRRQIGLVTQETVLFEDTIFNNIAYGLADCPMDKVLEAAKLANAHDFITELPDRYQTTLSGTLHKLSGGQQQRLALARAVVRDPAILILDEATSALDAESESLIQQALANIVRGRVTFIIAHRLSTIRMADKVIVLEGGSVESIGTHDELIRTSRVYQKLYARDFSDEIPPPEKDNTQE